MAVLNITVTGSYPLGNDDDVVTINTLVNVPVTVFGGGGNDNIKRTGGTGADTIFGGDGNDIIDQSVNIVATQLNGDGGDDSIIGGTGNDTIAGGSGNDTIEGKLGNDKIFGEAGDDVIVSFVGTDTVDGGDGKDTFQIKTVGTDDLNLSGAPDADFKNVEIIDGSGVGAFTLNFNGLGKQTDAFTILGGSGGDTITLNVTDAGLASSIDGAGGNDTINGSKQGDTILGGAGADVIDGKGGADLIDGGADNDAITGGDGDDTIIGFVGADAVDGGAGKDTIKLTATSTDLNSAADNNIKNVEIIDASGATAGVKIDLTNQTEAFTINGSFFSDTITGGAGADSITGGDGDDVIVGFKGADTVDGGAGKNTISLTATSADLNSATDAQIVNIQKVDASGAVLAGVDINLSNQTEASGFEIIGSGKADTITGSKANDTISGFTTGDKVDGKEGVNRIDITATSDGLNNAADGDIVNIQGISAFGAGAGVTIKLSNQTEALIIQGSNFGDSLVGTSKVDILLGEDGKDTLLGGDGGDGLYGGKGDDSILGEAGSDGILGEAGQDTIDGGVGDDGLLGGDDSDSILGGDGNDVIYGDNFGGGGVEGNDTLFGNDGKDSILGQGGNDVLVGGLGDDVLVGGAGNDRFAFSTGALFVPGTFGNDIIADFNPAEDFIILSKTTFTAFTASSGDVFSGGTAIAAADFATIASGGATAAGNSSALIVYETSTATLYYNQDRATAGLGVGGAFATVLGPTGVGAANLTADRILIVG